MSLKCQDSSRRKEIKTTNKNKSQVSRLPSTSRHNQGVQRGSELGRYIKVGVVRHLRHLHTTLRTNSEARRGEALTSLETLMPP